jgi:hypothetical protein
MIPEYALNGEDVRGMMLNVMEKHLSLKTEGYRSTTNETFNLLLKAVAEGSSLEAVCADSCGAMASNTLREQGGFTCGIIPNAGTVILIPGTPAPTAAIPPTALSNCRVTTTNILNLRAEPDANSAVLTKVPYQTTLSASARSGEWLQVVFGNQQGWVSASYLSLTGDCG